MCLSENKYKMSSLTCKSTTQDHCTKYHKNNKRIIISGLILPQFYHVHVFPASQKQNATLRKITGLLWHMNLYRD